MSELIIRAAVDNLPVVQKFVRDNLDAACPTKFLLQLELVVEEIFVNVAEYAYAPQVGTVNISISKDENGVMITFRDFGAAYDPLKQAEPDITLPLDSRAPGGLGIFLTKQMVDDITWRRIDGENILRLTKRYRPK